MSVHFHSGGVVFVASKLDTGPRPSFFQELSILSSIPYRKKYNLKKKHFLNYGSALVFPLLSPKTALNKLSTCKRRGKNARGLLSAHAASRHLNELVRFVRELPFMTSAQEVQEGVPIANKLYIVVHEYLGFWRSKNCVNFIYGVHS